MFDSDVLFDDGTVAVSSDGYGSGDALNVGPGTYTIEIVPTAVSGSWGSDKVYVRESDDDTYNDLGVVTIDELNPVSIQVKTEKEYLKLYHDLTTITSITVVAGIVAAENGGV